MMPSNKGGHHYDRNEEIMNNAYLANFLRRHDHFYVPSVLQ